MKMFALASAFSVATVAVGGVVIHMPPPPAAVQSTSASGTALQRFAAGEPAKDRAGNVLLYTLPPTVTYNGGGSSWGGGSGWGGYGWGGYGWGGYGWGYPIILTPCCNPCENPMPVWRGTSVSIGIGL
jgi:hypothetical protein